MLRTDIAEYHFAGLVQWIFTSDWLIITYRRPLSLQKTIMIVIIAFLKTKGFGS